ncbi:MBL fold metallo-hydrolase [Natrinema altunense]|uniref:Beta-lactamase domain protein n=1 Tax=Natrinema altunense (strain JCM 12890 / CGMCC 1.3731 / AJ2) TaxID=1227494 RepID=L9ZTD9_NATA2|nr:MBL fold metallo-hydrolase [Natrinema altunense]ELY89735.1 beta-lactamase domain protein [Natrinema altunense JCM 12890]
MTPDASCGGARLETVCSRIHRLEFDVPWPPKHVAAYLLEGPEPILIDAGAPDETGGSDRVGETELREGLAEVDAVPADIDHVLVTHIHSDHIGQLPALRAAGATVHAPKAGLARLETDLDTVRAGLRETARSAGYDDDLETVLEEELDSRRRDRRLVDGESARPIDPTEPFAVGGREFRVFETPGHEIDHLCFETTVEGTDVLFAGDALIEPFRAGAFHVGFDRGAYEAVDAYYEAMDRLQGTSATHVFPGHGPVFEDPQRVVETTRDRLDTLLAETATALEAIEPATPRAIAEERVGNVRYHAPVLDTLGALGTLETRGRVSYETEEGVRYYETA